MTPRKNIAWRSVLLRTIGAFGLLALVLPHAAFAQVVEGPLDALANASGAIMGRLTPYAVGLFTSLVAIELCFSLYVWMGEDTRYTVKELLYKAISKVGLLGIIGLALILSYQFWFPPIIAGFQELGVASTGGAGVAYSPFEIYEQGEAFYTMALRKIPNSNTLLPDIISKAGITYLIAGVILWVTMIIIAIELAIFTAEAFVVLGAGIVMVAFAGLTETAKILDDYTAYLFNLGIRIFMLYLLVGLLQPLVSDWIAFVAAIPPGPNTAPILEVVGAALLYLGIAATVPYTMGHFCTRTFSPGVSDLLARFR